MAGINVLSDTPKGGSKLEKTSTSKRKDITDSPGNAATEFAAMLNGSMNPIANPRGQNSSVVGRESEEMQSADNPKLSIQNSNGQGSMPGYGNYALSFLSQPMLQSELPAGKEANSGDDVSQRTGDLTTANQALLIKPNSSDNSLELAILNLVTLASDEISAQSGMTMPKSQGDNPRMTELDKYRQVIADLLVALSGEITDNSPGTTSSSSEGNETKNLGQDMAKAIQGWMTLIDEGAENGQITSGQATESMKEAVSGDNAALSSKGNNPISSVSNGVKDIRQDLAKIVQDWMTLTNDDPENASISTFPDQKGIQSLLDVLTQIDILTKGQSIADSELNARASALPAAFNPIVNSQGVKDTKAPQAAEVTETFQAESDMIDPMSKGHIDTPMNKPKGMKNALEPAVTVAKDTAIPIKTQQKSAEAGLRESKPLSVQGTLNEEIHKGTSKQSVELSGGKDVQNQNPSAGVGVLSNIAVANVADGKAVAIPVLEQIATVFREQITDRHQELKELDIKLHPADLGKIQIALRWENGQVHLQVHASVAATSQILQNQLSDLRHTLTSQGVNCGMLQMGQGGEHQQNSREDSSQRTFKQKLDLNKDEDLIPGLSPLSIGQDGINRINVTA